jgi:hypothetical protein
MYYPEANVLVPPHADPLSLTPAFKSVPVRVLVDGTVGVRPLPVQDGPVASRPGARETRAC